MTHPSIHFYNLNWKFDISCDVCCLPCFLPAVDRTPLFSLVNIVLYCPLTTLSTADSERLQCELVCQLREIVSEEASDSIRICKAETFGGTAHFITLIPYSKACYLLECWSDENKRLSLHRRLASLPFLSSTNAIVSITSHLGDEHWRFPRDGGSSKDGDMCE